MELVQKLDEKKWGHYLGLYKCQCGREVKAVIKDVKRGHNKSCGCARGEPETGMRVRHKPEYRTWLSMRQRCFNEKNWAYKYYGEIGITVCDEWNKSFLTFYGDMGDRPSPDHSIDRIDNDLNYCKENCRWATRSEQQRNKGHGRMRNENSTQ